MAHEEIVQALTRRFLIDSDKARRQSWAWFALYNVIHLRDFYVSG
ncbi:hypothetical protein [Acidovorax sp. HDW3]|nr:hypothetical protein [Acidovorax sp. HDW3]